MKKSILTLLAIIAHAAFAANDLSHPPVAPKWVPVPIPAQSGSPVKVLLPAARDANAPGGLPLRKLIDVPLRDPQITRGGDGYFYMVGTEMDKNTLPAEVAPNHEKVSGWHANNGIPLWRSKDLVNWETLGYAWTFEKDATWQKGATNPRSGKFLRAIWAPEIHYIKGRYWIAYSVNYRKADGGYFGTGLLRSTTGKPEGPYTDVKPEGPLTDWIDASLFEDTDGKVYFLADGYQIARMNDDMTALAEPPRKVEIKGGKYLWAEGISMIKENGKYIFGHASVPCFNETQMPQSYDYFSSVSHSVYGPYEPMKRALPHCGHNNFFKDAAGNWWSTYFGTDPSAPFCIRPGVVAVEIDKQGRVSAKRSSLRPVWKFAEENLPEGKWWAADYDDSGWKRGDAAFGEQEISQWGPVTLPATSWRGRVLWMRQSFDLKETATVPSLYLRHSGVNIRVWLNGKEVYSSKQSLHDYLTVPMPQTTLPAGRNVIAVECMNAAPNRYVDIGLVESVCADANQPGGNHTNPVWTGYCADPYALKVGDNYYVYGTHMTTKEAPNIANPVMKGKKFILLRSRNLVDWECLGGALNPYPGGENVDHWAPAVVNNHGKFWMYYSAADPKTNEFTPEVPKGSGWYQHLRVAVSDSAEGPFQDCGKWLLPKEGFTIDSDVFKDPKDGKWYLFFAKDTLTGRTGTGIWVVRLGDDMVTKMGEPTAAVLPSADWQISIRNHKIYGKQFKEWHTVEAPHIVFKDGKYYCFYSGAAWGNDSYGVSYAVADHPLGPWKDEGATRGPCVLKGVPGIVGTGHNSTVMAPDGKTLLCAYHAWDETHTVRQLRFDPIDWTNGPHVTPTGKAPRKP